MIRLATAADAPAVAAIYAPVVASTAISFEVEPPAAEEMAARIAAVLERTPWLVCDRGNGVVGFAYATKHRERAAYRWGVDVSVYVADSARRSGIGKWREAQHGLGGSDDAQFRFTATVPQRESASGCREKAGSGGRDDDAFHRRPPESENAAGEHCQADRSRASDDHPRPLVETAEIK